VTTEPTPRLLLVGGAGGVALSVDAAATALAQAKDRGIHTHLVNQAAALAATARANDLADEVSAVDFEEPGECARWVRGRDFDVVLGVREMAQVAVAESAEALGLAGNPPAAVRRVRTKDECREALRAAGFRQPEVRLCADRAEAAAFVAATPGPWVVKPRDAMGSVGVRLVTAAEELPAAVDALPDRRPFLTEEFVEGPEFSVEGVFLGGTPRVLAVTAKDKLPPPHFVELAHLLPAELAEPVRAEIERTVCAALVALELRFGVFHVELWLTGAGEVVLGEVHVRVGGDWLHRLLAHAIPGLDLFGLVLDDALGRPLPGDLTPSRAAAARFLVPPPGRLVAVHGWDEVVAHPAVLHADLSVEPGAVLAPVRESTGRAGVVLVGADTPAEARLLAEKLVSSVDFVVEPVPEVDHG
jgi:biotin carboxylase